MRALSTPKGIVQVGIAELPLEEMDTSGPQTKVVSDTAQRAHADAADVVRAGRCGVDVGGQVLNGLNSERARVL